MLLFRFNSFKKGINGYYIGVNFTAIHSKAKPFYKDNNSNNSWHRRKKDCLTLVKIDYMTLQDKPEQLQIEWGEIEYGLFDFTLKLSDQSFKTQFSDVYDPVPNLKHWLEAIAIGAQRTSFVYDTEGCEIRVDFNNEIWFRPKLVVYDILANPEKFCYLEATVDRKQLIEVFYKSLLNYVQQGGFKDTPWEENYKQDFSFFRSKIIEEFIA